MKISFPAIAATVLTLFTFSACNETGEQQSDAAITDTTTTAPITITPVGSSPEFQNAALGIKNIKATLQGTDSVKVTIDYDVKNYELKSQTSDAAGKGCNNSKDGQHIHFILDNAPYAALYEPTHTFTIPVNSTHYLMSFLSRSYHESLKNKEAAVLLHFSVDDKGKLTKLDNPATPMIFYSRPKGDYLGEDTKKVLLDFYVYNAKISPDSLQIKAKINETDFNITEWQSYFIENAPMGDLNVTLSLIDKNGNQIQGEHTTISRKVKLAHAEPMP